MSHNFFPVPKDYFKPITQQPDFEEDDNGCDDIDDAAQQPVENNGTASRSETKSKATGKKRNM